MVVIIFIKWEISFRYMNATNSVLTYTYYDNKVIAK